MSYFRWVGVLLNIISVKENGHILDTGHTYVCDPHVKKFLCSIRKVCRLIIIILYTWHINISSSSVYVIMRNSNIIVFRFLWQLILEYFILLTRMSLTANHFYFNRFLISRRNVNIHCSTLIPFLKFYRKSMRKKYEISVTFTKHTICLRFFYFSY